jgi:hypothetical protein
MNMNTTKTRKVTVITAGDKDWEPTSEELQSLVEQFIDAGSDPNNAVVSFRSGVNVRIVDVSATEGVLATTGWLSDDDIIACSRAFNAAALSVTGSNRGLFPTADGVAAFRAELDKRMQGE